MVVIHIPQLELGGSVSLEKEDITRTFDYATSKTYTYRDATISGVKSNGKNGTAFVTDFVVQDRLYRIVSLIPGVHTSVPRGRSEESFTHDDVRMSFHVA